MKKNWFFFVWFLFLPLVSYAYVPEPKSAGKYFSGKGTKASEQYEATAGMPTYDYGKGIQWGSVHIKPSFDYRLRWDDNVFFEESNEKNDIVNSFAGETLAELPLGGGQHLLSGAYGFNRELFNRFDSQNHTDQHGKIGIKLNYVPFTLDMEDVLERTVSRANTEFTSRIQRDENAFHSLLEIPFASFFLENEITDFNVGYKTAGNDPFNHNLFTFYQRIGHDWTPSTQILAEYAYTYIHYNNVSNRNGDANQFMLGLRGNFTELIAYQIWGGAQYRIYDEDAQPDFNGFVVRAAAQYQPSEISTWTLRLDRSPQESTFDNQNFYTRNQVTLNWQRQIYERIFWNSHGSVSYHEYSRITKRASTGEETTRRDTLWEAGTGLEYKMPNDIISFVVDWNYVNRDSNLSGLGYESNEISAGVRASF